LTANRALGDQGAECGGRDLFGVRPERVDVRVQPDASQPALVEKRQAAAVGEVEREAVPLSLARLRVAAPGAAALDWLAAARGRDDDAAAHAQVDAEVGAGQLRAAHP
jgi:hypothetical protein